MSVCIIVGDIVVGGTTSRLNKDLGYLGSNEQNFENNP